MLFQFHKETCSNSLINGHLLIYCRMSSISFCYKKSWENRIVNRIVSWVNRYIPTINTRAALTIVSSSQPQEERVESGPSSRGSTSWSCARCILTQTWSCAPCWASSWWRCWTLCWAVTWLSWRLSAALDNRTATSRWRTSTHRNARSCSRLSVSLHWCFVIGHFYVSVRWSLHVCVARIRSRLCA